MRTKLPAVLAALASATAFAHEGHGPSGPHWHATDVFGLVVLGGLIALAIWLSRGGK